MLPPQLGRAMGTQPARPVTQLRPASLFHTWRKRPVVCWGLLPSSPQHPHNASCSWPGKRAEEGERLLIPGCRRKNRKNQTYCSHFRYTLASAKQLGFMGFVCLLEGGGTQVSCSELARTRWRNSVHFHFLSTYSLVKRGLAYRKQWKFLRFLKGKG